MYSEIPPLFMYTNEPVKLILKSQHPAVYMRSPAIQFLQLFCGVRFRRVLGSERLSFTFLRGAR